MVEVAARDDSCGNDGSSRLIDDNVGYNPRLRNGELFPNVEFFCAV